MKTNCINCGVEFEDPRPGALVNMIMVGVIDPDLLKDSLSIEPYCPACSEEAARLNKIAHSMMLAASKEAGHQLKLFGENRRNER